MPPAILPDAVFSRETFFKIYPKIEVLARKCFLYVKCSEEVKHVFMEFYS